METAVGGRKIGSSTPNLQTCISSEKEERQEVWAVIPHQQHLMPQANLRGANLPTLGALGVGRKVALSVVVLSQNLRQSLPGVVGSSLHTVWHSEFLTVFMYEVVADFAANPRHLMHLLTANITELPLDRLLLRPAVGHRVLDNGGCYTDTGIGCGFQTFVVNEKIANFTVETIVNQFPVEKVQAVVAVDWSGTVERLLGERVSVIIHNRLLYIPHSDISSS